MVPDPTNLRLGRFLDHDRKVMRAPPGSAPACVVHRLLETRARISPEVAHWLGSAATRETLAALDANEARAQRRQSRYVAAARRAALSATLGTVLAAAMLLPIDQVVGHQLPKWIGLVQVLAMLTALGSVLAINWRRLLGRWIMARAETEMLRGALFASLMRAMLPAGDAARPALVEQLQAFEVCQLDEQRAFYRRRSVEMAKAAGSVTPLKLLGYLLILLSFVIGVSVAAGIVEEFGATLPWFLQWARELEPPEAARWQLGTGALATSALSLATTWTLISQDERNAMRYAATLAQLDTLVQAERGRARAAAVDGDLEKVLRFTDAVQRILAAENDAWVSARPTGNPFDGPSAALDDAV